MYKHYRLIQKKDLIVNYWWKVQLSTTLFFGLIVVIAANVATQQTWSPYFLVVSTIVFVLVTEIISIVGICKAMILRGILLSANKIIQKHNNEELKKWFKRDLKYLLWISIFDSIYPLTFPFGFLFKVTFRKNANRIKKFIGSIK